MASPKRKFQPHNERNPASEPQGTNVLPMPTAANEPQLALDRIGDILRRQREKRGDDLQQIADYLCIRRSFLIALENSHYDEFPADAYVIGFLRSYAEYLGLDGKETVDYYRREMDGRRKKLILAMPTPISGGRAPSAIILIGAIIAALLVYVLWYAISTSDRTSMSLPPTVPPVVAPDTVLPPAPTPSSPLPGATPAAPPHAGDVQQPAMPAAAAAAPAQNSAPVALAPTPAINAAQPQATVKPAPVQATAATTASNDISHLTIKADQASWVLVSDAKGHAVFDHVMKAGEVYKVPDAPGLTLTTGNAAGVTLSFNGAALPKLSNAPSHIVRGIPLDPEQLKNLPATPAE